MAALAFLQKRIETRITRGAQSEVEVPGRTMRYTFTGDLRQNYTGSRPKYRYTISHGVRSRADFDTLKGIFFIVHFAGPYQGFRMKDWGDFIASRLNTSLVNVGGSIWQLQRKYSFEGYDYADDIQTPIDSTVVVYDAGGSILTATVGDLGLVDVTGTPATWSGEFDRPVTFSANTWSATWEVHTENLHLMSGDVQLESIRVRA